VSSRVTAGESPLIPAGSIDAACDLGPALTTSEPPPVPAQDILDAIVGDD
jgi:hypothetical protein